MVHRGRHTAFVVCLFLADAAAPSRAAVPDPLRDDARLADVCFVDALRGWAVGDRGVVWHTADGGAHWGRQPTGVDGRLTTVHFVDARHGWAAGGWTEPFTLVSHGIVLATSDGGEHWSADPKLLLPAVRRSGFFDAAHGWAIAELASAFSSTVFTTADGGRTWSSLPTGGAERWLTGDFVRPATGAVAGAGGALGLVRGRQVVPSASPAAPRAEFTALRFSSPRLAWATGRGGLVRHSTDGGQTWRLPPGELPAGAADQFDFHALAVHGSHVWIAGTPGTRVLHSGDEGRTWQALDTGQPLPLWGLCFVDERHGWAVGELGLVLATDDGGHSWRAQHGGSRRAALLGLLATADELPAELLVRLSADEGYRAAIEVVGCPRPSSAPSLATALDWRVHEGAVLAGGSAGTVAWRFPLGPSARVGPAEQVLSGWDDGDDGEGIARLEAWLAARIRQWRPDVVIAPPEGSDSTPADIVRAAVLRAVERAADESQYPEQLAVGLAAWRTKRVFVPLAVAERGGVTLTAAQLAPRLGVSLADLGMLARGLVEERWRTAPATIAYRPLAGDAAGRQDFFAGIPQPPGGPGRREPDESERLDLPALRRAAQARRNLQAIVGRALGSADDARLLSELGQLARRLPPDQAASALFAFGQRLAAQGKLELAAEAFEQLAERAGDRPLSSAALAWLVRYYASSETAWHAARQGRLRAARVVQIGGADRAPSESAVVPASGTRDASGDARSLVAPQLGRSRAAKAAGFAAHLQRSSAALAAEPAIRFPVAAAERANPTSHSADRTLVALFRARPHDDWWRCAAAENWLTERRGAAPKPVCVCRRAATPPRLDGHLDDEAWTRAEPIELASDVADFPPTATLLAYDAEFIYLAAVARPTTDAAELPTGASRPRDALLAARDRLEWYLDVDRDYTTWFRLAVDQRGWTREDCWGDPGYDPQWFVAVAHEDGLWTIEAAIPLAELVPRPPGAGSAWALGVQRIAPHVGIAAWPEPAAEIAPQAFGLLLFE